jgi:hypothetical protein
MRVDRFVAFVRPYVRGMDGMMFEVLSDARKALEEVRDVREAKELRLRREMVERAAERLDLLTSPPDHVVRIALLALAVRDDAEALRSAQRCLLEALREVMD